jgi:hypothetical protein
MDVMARTHVGDPTDPELSLRYTTEQVGLGDKKDQTILLVTNPDPASGIALGPFKADKSPEYTGVGLTLSCQPDGTLQVRPKGAWAEYESASIDGAGNVLFWPGQAFPNVPDMPKNQRGICYKFLGAKNVPVVRP